MTSELERRKTGPKKGQRVGQQGRGQQRDSQWVNRELSAQETLAYREWRADMETVDLLWREALDSGYKFSVKWDDYSNSVACFMFPPDGGDNEGFILAGRGGTGWRAVSEALYKHTELLGGVWDRGGSSVTGPDDPDW